MKRWPGRFAVVLAVALLLGFVFHVTGTGWVAAEAESEQRNRSDLYDRGPRFPVYLRAGTIGPDSERDLLISRRDLDGWLTQNPYLIVQLEGPILVEWLIEMEDAGLEVLEYLPEFAYIVRGARESVRALQGMPFVVWIGPFKMAYRISPDLRQMMQANVRKTAEISLDFFAHPSVEISEIQPPLGLMGLRAVRREGRLRRMSGAMDVSRLARLEDLEKMSPHVRWIEPVYQAVPLNEQASWVVQSYEIDHRPLWSRGLHGEGQIVGIADTGVDYDSCFFEDPSRPVPVDAVDLNHRKIVAYECFVAEQCYDDPDLGHGTHVAGTVAGDPDPGNSEMNRHRGVAYRSKVYFQDFGDGYHLEAPLELREFFFPAYEHGARIHSNSWGELGHNEYSNHSKDVDEFMWEHRDFLVLFAAGNGGPSVRTIQTPSTNKNGIAVGSSHNHYPDENRNPEDLAYTSAHGPTPDNRIKPDIIAPGHFMISASSDGEFDNPTCEVKRLQGTSMATPVAAGSAALLRQFFTEGWYPSGQPNPSDRVKPSAALLKAMLIHSARPMTGSQARPIPDYGQGWGRIVLEDVLGDPQDLRVWDEGAGMTTDESWSDTVTVSTSDRALKVVLVWTDHYAATSASVLLVNDLDLIVTAPDGETVYRGNIFSGGFSVPDPRESLIDRRNPVEAVVVPMPAVGDWTIEVAAYNVPKPFQPFALVVTADMDSTTTNDPPVVSAGTDQTIALTEVAELDGVVSDDGLPDPPGVVTTTWSKVSGPGVVSFADPSALQTTAGFSVEGTYALRLTADDGEFSSFDQVTIRVTSESANLPPTPPSVEGPARAEIGMPISFTAVSTDPEGGALRYTFDWGDGDTDETDFSPSGTFVTMSHTYPFAGDYVVMVQALDEAGLASDWSVPRMITVVEDVTTEVITATTANTYAYFGRSSHYLQQAQSFRAEGENLCRVSVALARYGRPSEDITVHLRSNVRGSDLAKATISNEAVTSTRYLDPTWVDVTFPECVTVAPGMRYYLVLSTPEMNGYNYYRLPVNTSNPYRDGEWYKGSAAIRQSSQDMLVKFVFGEADFNTPPERAFIEDGPTFGTVEIAYTYLARASDPDGDQIRYVFDWGDGQVSETGLVDSNTAVPATHVWQYAGTYTVIVRGEDMHGVQGPWSRPLEVAIEEAPGDDNLPPGPPDIVGAPTSGHVGELLSFSMIATDPDGDHLYLVVDWGDGVVEETDFFSSGSGLSLSHAWIEMGMYDIRARAVDESGAGSSWSEVVRVEIGSPEGMELVISDAPSGTWYLGSSNTRRRQAQTFKAIGSTIQGASVALTRIGSPTESIRVTIRRSLTQAPLASAEIDPSQVTSVDEREPSWVTVHFTSPAAVREGYGYFLVLEVSRADSLHYYRVGYDKNNPYPYGMWYPDAAAREDLDMVCTLTFGH